MIRKKRHHLLAKLLAQVLLIAAVAHVLARAAFVHQVGSVPFRDVEQRAERREDRAQIDVVVDLGQRVTWQEEFGHDLLRIDAEEQQKLVVGGSTTALRGWRRDAASGPNEIERIAKERLLRSTRPVPVTHRRGILA